MSASTTLHSITFVDGVAGGSCMYGFRDSFPSSVNKLSTLLELILLSLDSDSETRPLWCAAVIFSTPPSVTGQSVGGRFQLGNKNRKSHDFKCLISNTSKLKASSTTYYISYRDYKLLICSIKIPFYPRSLNKQQYFTTDQSTIYRVH